jgi:hypothetical protein
MDKVLCECGSMISKKQLSKHKQTKKHLNVINKKTLDLTSDTESSDTESNDTEEHTETQSQNEDDEDEERQRPEELVIKPILKQDDVAQRRREHLNKIREKAHEAIRQKKLQKLQEKVNKEVEIETKAKMYDELIEKQKRDEELRIQKEQEQKEKEIKRKVSDYDKILEENLKLKAKQNITFNADRYAQHALIDNIRQQRMDYLTRHLGINL